MATACGAIEKLVVLLSDSDFQTRSAAASALASITVDEAARQHAAKETSLVNVMPTICADPYDQVQLFAVKLLAVLLERPTWRDELRETCKPILEEIVRHTTECIPCPACLFTVLVS